jgi:hypothetical protein
LCFIRVPGRPNSRRDKLLNETLFMSRAHAQVEIATWVEDYKRERPQAQLGSGPIKSLALAAMA